MMVKKIGVAPGQIQETGGLFAELVESVYQIGADLHRDDDDPPPPETLVINHFANRICELQNELEEFLQEKGLILK